MKCILLTLTMINILSISSSLPFFNLLNFRAQMYGLILVNSVCIASSLSIKLCLLKHSIIHMYFPWMNRFQNIPFLKNSGCHSDQKKKLETLLIDMNKEKTVRIWFYFFKLLWFNKITAARRVSLYVYRKTTTKFVSQKLFKEVG